MKFDKHTAVHEIEISYQKQVEDRIVLIRDIASELGISSIDVEPSDLLKDTFRIKFDDCTGRKQTLFIPLAASRARVAQTLRFIFGPRKRGPKQSLVQPARKSLPTMRPHGPAFTG